MNILAEVTKEQSKAMCNRVVRYVGSSPSRFRELVKVFLAGPYRVTQRAAWPISCCVESHPKLIEPHLRTLVRYARRTGVHDAVRRNIVRLMQFIEIPPKLQGEAADLCFAFLQDISQPIAVRCFSMTVLANLSASQPELRGELKIIIEDLLPYASSGMTSRARKILKKI